MPTVHDGDRVRVHFTCNFDDSSKIASTGNGEPLELTIAECKLIECFEKSVIGITKGQKKTIHLQPYQAMGEKRPELISQVPLHLVPEQDEALEVGGRIQIKDNHKMAATQSSPKFSNQMVAIEANHPLAGEVLIFDIELIELL
jgi:peptidylprolyl isomerase